MKKLDKNSYEKEIKKVNSAVKKAKKEIKEAEEATSKAYDEVIDTTTLSQGIKKQRLVGAAKDLEKANYLAAESCESTEEAEFKIKNSK